MAFGKEIKRLREEAGFSAQKLADTLGVDADRLRKWEQNDQNPRSEDRMKIEDFFGMNLDTLQAITSIKKFLNVPRVPNTLLPSARPLTVDDYVEALKEQKRLAEEYSNRLERILEGQINKIAINSDLTVAGMYKISLETESLRTVALQSLSRLEKKQEGDLLRAADKVKGDRMKAASKQGMTS